MVITKLQDTFGDTDGVSEHGVPAVVLFENKKKAGSRTSVWQSRAYFNCQNRFQSRQFGCKTDTLTCGGKKNT